MAEHGGDMAGHPDPEAPTGASFESTKALCRHIARFVKGYNGTAKPLVWRKREVGGRGFQATYET